MSVLVEIKNGTLTEVPLLTEEALIFLSEILYPQLTQGEILAIAENTQFSIFPNDEEEREALTLFLAQIGQKLISINSPRKNPQNN